MSYLKGFGLENFRVFKDYTWFDFAPITILVGPNSSGKSSLIKALLLLQDNISSGNLPTSFDLVAQNTVTESDGTEYLTQHFAPSKLKFNDLIHGLNNPSAVVNKLSGKKEVIFDIPFLLYVGLRKKNLIYRLTFEMSENNLTAKYITDIFTKDEKSLLQVTPNSIYFDTMFYEEFFNESFISTSKISDLKRLIEDDAEVSLRDWFLRNHFTNEESELFARKVLGSFFMTHCDMEGFNPSPMDWDKQIIHSVFKKIKSIDHFSTIWNQQKRVYTEDDGLRITHQLKKFATQMNKEWGFHSFFKEYVKSFGIKGLPDVDYDENRGTLFPNINGESFLSFGYGYSQIASILFKIAIHTVEKITGNDNNPSYYDEGPSYYDSGSHPSILMLEEPETNLHPKLQSQLADLFADVMNKFDTQFIIETHSEYMIRKFQHLVAKGEMKPEDVVIHYFHDPNTKPVDEPQVKKITILKDGSLSDDFGPGFYDEANSLKFELLRLKNSRNN